MCIALFKESGVGMPKKKLLKRCFVKNPDGAGFGIYDKEQKLWNVSKGFMEWNEFWESFNSKNLNMEDKFIVHFRIGTSGKKVHADCTHPFPISDSEYNLMANEYSSPTLVAHNGTWGSGEENFSDTQVAIRDIISVLIPFVKDIDKDEKLLTIIGTLLKENSNRWFISFEDNVLLFGDWEKDKKTNIWFSNTKYKETKILTTNHYSGAHNNNTNVIEKLYLFTDTATNYIINEVWGWSLWDKKWGKKKDSNDDKVTEVFDKNGDKLIAIVDVYGNVVYGEEKETKSKKDKTERKFPCPTCGNNISLQIIGDNEGECCFCYNKVPFLVGRKDIDEIDWKKCPLCGEINSKNTNYIYYSCGECFNYYDEDNNHWPFYSN